MKRWSILASFLLFLLLCASIAYWGLQLFKPPLRPVAAPPRAAAIDVRPEAGAALFGGRAGKAAVASNYQLHGVILAGTADNSVAILSANGKPAEAVRVDKELLPGVSVKEVHRDYVLLTENGVVKRVELPENASPQSGLATTSPIMATPTPPSRTGGPPPQPNQLQSRPQATMPAPAVSVNPAAGNTASNAAVQAQSAVPGSNPATAASQASRQATPTQVQPTQTQAAPAQPTTTQAAPAVQTPAPATAVPYPPPAPVQSAPDTSGGSGEMRETPLRSR